MSETAIKAWFPALSEPLKARFVCHVAHELTVTARDRQILPDGGSEEDATTLRSIFEVLHVLTGHLSKLLVGDQDRYPDDLVWDIALEKASPRPDVKIAILHAIERARRYAQS
jgi:hypothetical protein